MLSLLFLSTLITLMGLSRASEVQAGAEYKRDLADQLSKVSATLKHLSQRISMTEAQLQSAKQLRLGEPDIEVDLLFDVSAERTQVLADEWLKRKYIDQSQYDHLKSLIQGSATYSSVDRKVIDGFYALQEVSFIQTRAEPRSGLLAYGFCKVPQANQTLNDQQSKELYKYLQYVTRNEWLDYYGPTARLMIDAEDEYAKYLPTVPEAVRAAQ